MTITGHIIRIDRRVDELWPRDVLEREMEHWLKIWSNYLKSLRPQWDESRIKSYRYFTFKRIVREAVQRIQDTLDMIDILEGKPVSPRP